MDKLSGLASKLGGGSGGSKDSGSQSTGGQEDYLDKGKNHHPPITHYMMLILHRP